jgi:phosphoglucosamine mutase
VVQVIAESRDRLGKDGRLVIRESGTEPVIRVMAESDNAKLVDAVIEDIASTIRRVA